MRHLSVQQLVDSDTVDPSWDGVLMDNAFVFARREHHVHGGQLQLHRNQGFLQGFELHRGSSSEVSRATVVQQPVSIDIETDQSSFEWFMLCVILNRFTRSISSCKVLEKLWV